MAKFLKVTIENRSAIEFQLAAGNRGANEHTFQIYSEINQICVSAEKRLTELLGSKIHFPGARISARSGGALPNAYKFSRVTTRVELVRKPTGWFLVSVVRETAYQNAGRIYYTLTPKQDDHAVALLRSHYRIAEEVVAPIAPTATQSGPDYTASVYGLQ
jgi:hypothetical protein